jgi:hypothetical protein
VTSPLRKFKYIFRINVFNFFNQVLNVQEFRDVRQMEIHTAELLVPEASLVKVEIAIGKLRSYKSPGTDQIPAELIKAGGEAYVLRYTGCVCTQVSGSVVSNWPLCEFHGRVYCDIWYIFLIP